jgi:EAL domain-containing protein (putative c-di-GMP-specific phosphodiesterase class I)
MKAAAGWFGRDDRLCVDEVGIEYGSFERSRLRATYRPIFARSGDRLERVALEGGTVAAVAGEPVRLIDLLVELPATEHAAIERLRLALQLRNLHHTDGAEGQLLLDLEPLANTSRAKVLAELDLVTGEIGRADIDAAQVVCMLPACLAETWPAIAAHLRRHGIGIAMGGFGTADWSQALFHDIRPDIVQVDGEWFGQVCRFDATVRLFGSLVARLQGEARVLVSSVDTPELLTAALRAGVGLLQGGLLGGHALAGADADDRSLDVEELLHPDDGAVGALR